MRKTRGTSRFLFFFICIAVACAFALILFGNGKKWYERRRQEKDIAVLEKEIATLKREEQEKQLFLETLQKPFFIEREAREKFGAKKEGETVVVFPKSLREEGEEKRVSISPPFFRYWFQYFFPKQIQ